MSITKSREKMTLHMLFFRECFLANMGSLVSSIVNGMAAKTRSVILDLILIIIDYRGLGRLSENPTSP